MLRFSKKTEIKIENPLPNVYWLSEFGTGNEIAYNLYHLLRAIDVLNYSKIFIEDINNEGKFDELNVALKDRYQKQLQGNQLSIYFFIRFRSLSQGSSIPTISSFKLSEP